MRIKTAVFAALIAALNVWAEFSNMSSVSVDEEEPVDPKGLTERSCILVILTVLVVLSVIFEFFEEFIEHKVSEDMEPIVARLWGEMTTLGFLSVISFIFVKSGVLEKLSEELFDEGEQLPELVESIHMTLFLVMCVFLFEVLLLILLGSVYESWWHEHHHNMCVLSSANMKKKNKKLAKTYTWEGIKARSCKKYILLHAQFVNTKLGSVKIPENFDLAEYLCIRMSHILEHMVHISPLIWICVEIFFVAVFFFLAAPDSVQIIVSIAGMYIALGILVFVQYDLKRITQQLCPKKKKKTKNPETGSAASRAVSAESTDLESTYLLSKDIEDFHLPYKKNQSKLKPRSRLGSKIFGRPPNEHEMLFWFEKYGPEITSNFMRFMLLISALYSAILSIHYVSKMFVIFPTPIAVVLCVLGYLVLPLYWLVTSLIVYQFTIATSIEMMKCHHSVKKALRRSGTRSALATLKLLGELKVTLTSMGNITECSAFNTTNRRNVEDISDRQRLKLERVFDIFDKDKSGDIDIHELKEMIQFTGHYISNDKLHHLIKTADTDGNGVMDKEEFITFMATYFSPGSENDDDLDDDTLKMMFRVFDKDDSGHINDDEFREGLNSLGTDLGEEDVAAILGEIDHDRSGLISLQEFKKLILSHLED